MKKSVTCIVEIYSECEDDGTLEDLLSSHIEDAFAESYNIDVNDISVYGIEVINE